MRGLCSTVSKLLERGLSVDALDDELSTPLHLAAEQGYDQVALVLLAEGARLDMRNMFGSSVLHAAFNGNVDYSRQGVIEALLSPPARADTIPLEDLLTVTEKCTTDQKFGYVDTRLVVCLVKEVARRCSVDVLKNLLTNSKSACAVDYAMSFCDVMFEDNCLCYYYIDDYELMVQLRAFQYLKMEAAGLYGRKHCTMEALSQAAAAGDEIKVDMSKKDPFATALHAAASNGQVKVVDRLLMQWPAAAAFSDRSLIDAMVYAYNNGYQQVFVSLATSMGNDFNHGRNIMSSVLQQVGSAAVMLLFDILQHEKQYKEKVAAFEDDIRAVFVDAGMTGVWNDPCNEVAAKASDTGPANGLMPENADTHESNMLNTVTVCSMATSEIRPDLLRP